MRTVHVCRESAAAGSMPEGWRPSNEGGVLVRVSQADTETVEVIEATEGCAPAGAPGKEMKHSPAPSPAPALADRRSLWEALAGPEPSPSAASAPDPAPEDCGLKFANAALAADPAMLLRMAPLTITWKLPN